MRPLRPVQSVVIRPSENLGVLGARFLDSPAFSRKRGLMTRCFRRFAGNLEEADLASYLLFDGDFAAELIELGRADAAARHGQLVSTLSSALESRQGADAA
jgi:NTE family protein